jgi:ubiquinone biosynthesis protein
MQLSDLARIPRTLRNIARGREIAAVIARHGFDDLLDRTGLTSTLGRIRRFLTRPVGETDAARPTTEERIRRALEDLGPTFVKFGQVLATRPDLLPPALVHELRKLQDDVAPFPAAEAERLIEAELGAPVEALFAAFDPRPLAAASIAQVHRARLATGEEVVVKVQRPDLLPRLKKDLDILRMLAALIQARIPESRPYRPVDLVEEFERSILREIDFARELHHLQRFGRQLADDPAVHVPKGYEHLSTARVLTLEYVEGIKVDHVEAIDRAGIDRKAVAENATRLVLRQIFEFRSYHADPHPGNFFVLPDGRICLVDYGMIGTVDGQRVDELLTFLVSVLMNDMDRMIRLFADMELIDETVDVRRLKAETGEFVERYSDLPLGRLDVGKYLADLFDIIQRHHVRIPSDILLMAKTVATMESVAQSLSPEFDPFAVMRPYLLNLYVRRLTEPGFLVSSAAATLEDYHRLARRLPAAVEEIVGKLRRGELRLKLDVPEMRVAARARARSTRTLAVAIVLAATLASSTLLLVNPLGPPMLGIPLTTLAGAVGLVLSGLVALVLAWGIWRGARS